MSIHIPLVGWLVLPSNWFMWALQQFNKTFGRLISISLISEYYLINIWYLNKLIEIMDDTAFLNWLLQWNAIHGKMTSFRSAVIQCCNCMPFINKSFLFKHRNECWPFKYWHWYCNWHFVHNHKNIQFNFLYQ